MPTSSRVETATSPLGADWAPDNHSDKVDRGRSNGRTGRRTSPRQRQIIASISLAGATSAMVLARSAPADLWLIDALYRGAFAIALTYAMTRSRRWTWALAAVGATLFASGIWTVFGLAGAACAAFATLRGRHRLVGAACGAFTATAILHLSPGGPHGTATLIAIALCLPVAISAIRLLDLDDRRRMKRGALICGAMLLVAVIGAGVASLFAARNVRLGVAQVESGIEAARAGDNDTAMGRLTRAQSSLSSASSWLSSPLTLPARALPVLGQHMRAAQVASAEGTALTTAARDVGINIELDDLTPMAGRLDLDAVDLAAAPLERLSLTVDRAIGSLDEISSPWLLGIVEAPLSSFHDQLRSLQTGVNTSSLAAKSLPALLGGDEPVDYLVIFPTPAEARGLGGFIGSWAILRADDGQLSLTETGRAKDINEQLEALDATLAAPDDYRNRWQRFRPDRHFQDVTFSPDFPTVAAVARDLFAQTGQPVDGVISIDPDGLAALLRLTGPIVLPSSGQELNTNNARQFLLIDQYENFDDNDDRVGVLEEATAAVFNALLEAEFPDPTVIAETFGPVVDQGRIRVWNDGPGREVLTATGLDGAFPQPSGSDFFSLTHQNSANNKIDVYLDRSVRYEATYDPTSGQTTATATITVTNNAPATGLAPAVLGSNDQGLPEGTNRMYLSVYSPLQLLEAELDGEPFSLETNTELSWRTYSTFLSLGPGESTTLTLDLQGALATDGYELLIQPQPLSTPDSYALLITSTSGETIVDETPTVLAPTTFTGSSREG